MRLRLFFAWYDLWIGGYWNAENRILYLCLLPCVVIAVECGIPHKKDYEEALFVELNRWNVRREYLQLGSGSLRNLAMRLNTFVQRYCR